MYYYLVSGRKEILPYSKMRINLEDAMLDEMSQ